MAKKKKKPTPPPPPVARKVQRPAAGASAGPTRKQLQREAAAKQERSEALRRRLVAAGLATAAVAAVAAYVITDRRADAELRDTLTAGTCETDSRSDDISGGDGHVPAPRYRVNPPAGGDHTPQVTRAGVYRDAAVPEDGLIVHAQEHGYVVAWFSPELPADQQAQLEEFEREHDGDVIVAERAGMDTPVALTAWGQRLLCGEVEPAVFDRFFEEYVGEGPEDVPRG